MKNAEITFHNRLLELRGSRDRKKVADGLGLAVSTLRGWETNRIPDLDNLIMLANYYHVSVDYLIGASDTRSKDPEMQAIGKYTGLSDADIEVLHNLNEDESGKRFINALSKVINSDALLSGIYHYITFTMPERDARNLVHFKEFDPNDEDAIKTYTELTRDMALAGIMKHIERELDNIRNDVINT